MILCGYELSILQEGYLDLMLPVIRDTLRNATIRKPKTEKSALDRQAERRKKILEKMKKMQDQAAVFEVLICSIYRLGKNPLVQLFSP